MKLDKIELMMIRLAIDKMQHICEKNTERKYCYLNQEFCKVECTKLINKIDGELERIND